MRMGMRMCQWWGGGGRGGLRLSSCGMFNFGERPGSVLSAEGKEKRL
jgi:hypothetical protein